MSSESQDILLTSETARVLEVADSTVHWLEKTGRLPAQRTASGVRLFRRDAVEKLAAERKSKSAK
jgi:DNA-binding transcriptional MerR regulator